MDGQDNGTQRDIGKLEGAVEAAFGRLAELTATVSDLTKCVNGLCATVEAHIARHVERETLEAKHTGTVRWTLQTVLAVFGAGSAIGSLTFAAMTFLQRVAGP